MNTHCMSVSFGCGHICWFNLLKLLIFDRTFLSKKKSCVMNFKKVRKNSIKITGNCIYLHISFKQNIFYTRQVLHHFKAFIVRFTAYEGELVSWEGLKTCYTPSDKESVKTTFPSGGQNNCFSIEIYWILRLSRQTAG